MQNPFRYGDVASGVYFTNRTSELAELEADLRAGQNVVIISPRRYGKTSLVLKVIEKLREEGVLVAYLDMFRTPTKERFAEQLAKALFQGLVNPVERSLNQALDWFKQLAVKPQLTLSEDGTPTLDLAPASRSKDVEQTIEALLELPGQVAKKRKKRVVVILDEFQEVLTIDPTLPARMRAIFQLQGEVSHVFLGSKRHLMQQVFTDVNEPMYKLAKPLPLLPIGREDFTAFIQARFADTRKAITQEAIARILDITECHPHDTQELCYFAWSLAPEPGQVVDEALVERALLRVIEAEDARYTLLWESLSVNQRLVLSALTRAPGAAYSQAYRQAHRLGAASTVQKSLQRLQEKELVDHSSLQGHWIPDVFFRAWIRHLERST